MARQARQMSRSGFMHLITRGIGRQLIFEDRSDYQYYLKILERFSTETGTRICAYCLMENHVHLLAHGEPAQIVLLMKKLGVNYAGYFNKKYERTGHLFQDRYKSEPVEDEAYLLTVFRYILRNPEKAGICRASEYPWSSYPLYMNPPAFMDLEPFRERLGDAAQYAAFIGAENGDDCMEYDSVLKDDRWAQAVVQKCLGTRNGQELQQYDRTRRNEALKQLRGQGMTIRQIERMTGINRNIVQRVTSMEE